MRLSVVSPLLADMSNINVQESMFGIQLKTEVLKQTPLSVPLHHIVIFYHGELVQDHQRLREVGLKENEIIQVNQQPSLLKPTLQTIPEMVSRNPEALQQFIICHTSLLNHLLHVNPTMAEAVLNPDPTFLTSIIVEQNQRIQERRAREFEEIQKLNADPLNPANQAKIAEAIRLGNVEQNMKLAIQHNPESFGRVIMLYVPCKVNGVALTAFVDSGAQSTIMSERCAERCGIMRLVDTRFRGVAKGVGTAKIVGRVHAAPVSMGSSHFQCSFTILDRQDMDFLFGLDQLRRHQSIINLKDNCLEIHGQKIQFLAEKDLSVKLRAECHGEGPSGKQESTEEKVGKICSMLSCSTKEAAEALSVAEGDVERAVAYILSTRDTVRAPHS